MQDLTREAWLQRVRRECVLESSVAVGASANSSNHNDCHSDAASPLDGTARKGVLIGFVVWHRMTLLDFVGAYDAVTRLRTMSFFNEGNFPSRSIVKLR